MSTTVGIKLEDETRERLQKLGEHKDRSTHWMMKKAIAEYLEREEIFEREKLEDMDRWQRFQETGVCVTNEEMTTFFDGLVTQAQAAQK
ncbi:CopG family transcriptional regulator [Terasakiella brassicae]|uniref:CopG family transcriptional regulator n=1 Tax=Terasakiella brassicae TaxID=1634917 RepID=A0A917C761_9PROT|nr:ribbon-helix-helix protein, CopG family [Terasakiella brassicae]GGF73347.1 CopG family transcriptional regulator [Terasakiella brassicae]